MPEEKRKIPRLGKAAGEFNVSIGTITALLKKKNFDIEDNPNTKLTEEIYDILLHEFAKDKQGKAEGRLPGNARAGVAYSRRQSGGYCRARHNHQTRQNGAGKMSYQRVVKSGYASNRNDCLRLNMIKI